MAGREVYRMTALEGGVTETYARMPDGTGVIRHEYPPDWTPEQREKHADEFELTLWGLGINAKRKKTGGIDG